MIDTLYVIFCMCNYSCIEEKDIDILWEFIVQGSV